MLRGQGLEVQAEADHEGAGTRVEALVYALVVGVADFGVEAVVVRDDEGVLHEGIDAARDAVEAAALEDVAEAVAEGDFVCLLNTSPSPRDGLLSLMQSPA